MQFSTPGPEDKRSLSLGIAMFCLMTLACFAQRYSFRDTSDGLGDLNINCIAQDRTGYLWVGTENGLYRYDGSQFRQYGALEGIRPRAIQSIFLGQDGTLWVGTTAGVFFERKDGAFAEVRPPAPVDGFSQRIGSVFTSLAPDRIALADRSGAFTLHRVAQGVDQDQWVAEPVHLEGKAIWSVLAGPGGELWYGCDDDLCRFADGRTTHLGASLHMPSDTWLHLIRTRDGHIWIRGLAHLGELDPAQSRFTLHELPGRTNAVPYLALAEDADGRVVATQGPDFGLWENGRWRMVTAHNGLSRHDLSALFVDREGSLWMGSIGHGIARWLGQGRWEAYTGSEGLSDDIVWASVRDSKGRLWIGTESGVDYLAAAGDHVTPWRQAGIETSRAVSLAENEGIWVGSAAGVLIRVDENTLSATQWKVPEVYRVLTDGERRLWIATGSGLFAMDPRNRSAAPELVQDKAFTNPHVRFSDLCLDSRRQLWAASDMGLYRLDSAGWKLIDPGLAAVTPYVIAADRQGNLWATGTQPGLMRLRVIGNRVTEAAHITRPPLLSDQVVSMLVDSRGWLWLGQDAGLTVYDGRHWRSFTPDDGLIWNDLDTNGLTEDRDGSLWIGTSGGISHFMAPAVEPSTPPQSPVISQAGVGSTEVQNGSRIPWSGGTLAVSISTLSFRDRRHIRLRYRLVGLEKDWVETSEKTVRYPQLPPGSYRLEVEAVDITSGAASPVKSISFRVVPLWWQSELVPLCFSLLAGLAVLVLVRFRVRRLQTQKTQLESAVHRRTEDLEREKRELLDARDQLRHYAEHDGLTGLWNHRIIIDRLRSEIDRSQREGSFLGVILADVDHFKNINDTFGHQAGDQVLKEIGDIFARSVRSYDWVGRYGGEEFLLILPGSTASAARSRAEQMRQSVESMRVRYGNSTIPVTVSFGVASGLPANFEIMIQAADAALYRAKDNGRNCVMTADIQSIERP